MAKMSKVVHCDSVNGSDNLQDLRLPYECCSQASSLLQSVKYKKGRKRKRLQRTRKKLVLPKCSSFTLNTAGSFISFQIPSTPLEMKSLTRLAHHERAFDCVKSGNTQGPGHTSPKDSNKYTYLNQCFKRICV